MSSRSARGNPTCLLGCARRPQRSPARHADRAGAGSLLALLVELIGARRCIEVGTFTGYSSTAVALALPEDGQIVCCDVSEKWTSLARKYWDEAGVAGKIDLRIAPATETLDQLLAAGEDDAFDFAFIDADKAGYDGYYERLLRLVRPGGLIALDNTLWDGKVLHQDADDKDTRAIQALNAKLARRRPDHPLPAAGRRRRDTGPATMNRLLTMMTGRRR